MKFSTSFVLAAGTSGAMAYTVVNADLFMHKNIDPLVFPGEYVSHMHSFFGSDTVTVNPPTTAELQAGCSSAENPNDFSVYWIPTLYVSNDPENEGDVTEVPLSRFSAYYENLDDAEVAIPPDVSMIAGDATATTLDEVDPLYGIQWNCEFNELSEDKDAAEFPTQCSSGRLQSILLFQDCVNEDTLETAYSGTQNWNESFKAPNRCPENMKRMPQLRFSVRYNAESLYPDGWTQEIPLKLACGNSFCTHGDFINGWLAEAAQNMADATAGNHDFVGIDGPNGGYKDGSICTTTPTDADPDNGTSDYATSLKTLA